MRLSLSCWFLVPLFCLACRDEQAGPPHRPTAPRAVRASSAPFQYRSGARLGGGAIVYLGSRVSPAHAKPGDTVTLAHSFQALRAPPAGYAFFVHLVDPTTGKMLVNADHDFQGGAAPLERWPVGQVVEDVHTVTLPSVPSRVVLGFWQGGARLPVDDAQANDGQQRVLGPLLGGAQAALPEYRIQRASRAPVMDGDLGDSSWKHAERVQLVGSFDGRRPSLKTEVRLLYDDRFIYLAFEMEDPDVWGTYRRPDDPLYEQEVVEVFFDANADGRTYNELEVSPHNVKFDAYFPARRQGMDLTYDSGMRSAVKVRGTLDQPSDRDEGWTVEVQVPIERLAEVPHMPPRPQDRWRFNLYRLEHVERRRVEGQAFSPLFIGDFHALPRFGWLVFQ